MRDVCGFVGAYAAQRDRVGDEVVEIPRVLRRLKKAAHRVRDDDRLQADADEISLALGVAPRRAARVGLALDAAERAQRRKDQDQISGEAREAKLGSRLDVRVV